jgi:lipopolysaccharide/colanic/teichoic acid biosynthesis glycosyltransferase
MVFHPQAVVYHFHSSTLAAYFRKKFMIGYWKAQILRRFPGRAVQDSHTPQILKVQILLLALILAAAFGAFITFWSAVALALFLATFLVSTLPFLAKAWPKDHIVALAAPFLLGTRALALGFGYAWGLVRSQPNISQEHTIDGINYILKRATDILGGLLGLLCTIILWPFIAVAIKLDSEGPVIFKQERIGEEGRPFTLYKFRSMHANAEAELAQLLEINGHADPVFKPKDDPRLTRVGRILRRWSLDEMPQFWNVLKGEMSLVGPRPEETRVVAMYDDWHRRRLAVKPGMTGPMQVKGRGDLSLDKRVQLDLDYIEHYSLWRDIVILVQTIPAVIRGAGAH